MPLPCTYFNITQCLPLCPFVSLICSFWIHNQTWNRKLAVSVAYFLYFTQVLIHDSECVHNGSLSQHFKSKDFKKNIKVTKQLSVLATHHLFTSLFLSSFHRHHWNSPHSSLFSAYFHKVVWYGNQLLFIFSPSKVSWSYIPPGTRETLPFVCKQWLLLLLKHAHSLLHGHTLVCAHVFTCINLSVHLWLFVKSK